MKLSFQLFGVNLKESEASSLLNANDSSNELTVCLEDHLDTNLLDAKKLFNLSIETQQPALAALAAKLAIKAPGVTIKRSRKRPRASLENQQVSKLTAEEGIEKFATNKTLSSVGAVMVLLSLASVEENSITLRAVASDQVNWLFDNGVDRRSSVFNGFKRMNGFFHPLVAKPEKGLVTYHSSPIYNALREGSSQLVKAGFVTATAETQFGSEEKNLSGTQKMLRRKVYRFELTESGKEMINLWRDAEEFVLGYWNQRIN